MLKENTEQTKLFTRFAGWEGSKARFETTAGFKTSILKDRFAEMMWAPSTHKDDRLMLISAFQDASIPAEFVEAVRAAQPTELAQAEERARAPAAQPVSAQLSA